MAFSPLLLNKFEFEFKFEQWQYLHFAWGVAEAKCTVATAVSVSVCLSVCLSLTAFTDYCTDPDVTWGNSRGCPLVVHYWADLQSVHRFRCCDNTAPNAKCQRVLVLALCLVYQYFTDKYFCRPNSVGFAPYNAQRRPKEWLLAAAFCTAMRGQQACLPTQALLHCHKCNQP